MCGARFIYNAILDVLFSLLILKCKAERIDEWILGMCAL